MTQIDEQIMEGRVIPQQINFDLLLGFMILQVSMTYM